MWTELGTEGLIGLLDKVYEGTSDVDVHFDMGVPGGAGPAGAICWENSPNLSACPIMKSSTPRSRSAASG
jgi:hypothetical protein